MNIIFQSGIASKIHLVEEIDTKRKRKHDIIAVASYFQVSGETIEWQQHLKVALTKQVFPWLGNPIS